MRITVSRPRVDCSIVVSLKEPSAVISMRTMPESVVTLSRTNCKLFPAASPADSAIHA
jgi:hypothetical protein